MPSESNNLLLAAVLEQLTENTKIDFEKVAEATQAPTAMAARLRWRRFHLALMKEKEGGKKEAARPGPVRKIRKSGKVAAKQKGKAVMKIEIEGDDQDGDGDGNGDDDEGGMNVKAEAKFAAGMRTSKQEEMFKSGVKGEKVEDDMVEGHQYEDLVYDDEKTMHDDEDLEEDWV